MNKNDKDKEFPGYPHYAPKDDIMNAQDIKRVETDVENLSRSNKISPIDIPQQLAVASAEEINADKAAAEEDDIKMIPGTEADVTSEDLVLLGEKDADFSRVTKLDNIDMDEEDLDVPGSEEDDQNEEIGAEDEENNYYSLGGDAHENLEENG